MTDFSDCINYTDRVKVEFHERFRHMLQSIAALEARICELEDPAAGWECLLNKTKKQSCELEDSTPKNTKRCWFTEPPRSR